MCKGGQVRWYVSFALGALFGAFVFIALYGVRIVDVTYEDWLLTGWYDLSQHYVGWKLYRASGWHFPIGLCDTSFYPYLASVIYTDSIPAWSLFFKILSPILPETFQFFGLYGLFCFMMQGGMAKLLLRRVLKGEAECCLGCIAFLFCAPLWQRMYYHTALASHYLILAGMLIFIYRDRIGSVLKRAILWSALGICCISTHVTIYAIVTVVLAGFVLREVLDSVEPDTVPARVLGVFRTALIYFLPYLLSTLSVFYLFGGFYGNISGETDGLGAYSANLNSLFNPIDYSRIIKEFPLIDCQYEGLSYIGIMAIIMLLPGLAYIAGNYRRLWEQHKNYIISVLATSIMLWIIALSPKVTFGDHVLYEIPLPKPLYDAWSIFRASGRFLWPVMYGVILLSFYFARQEIKSFFTFALVAGCLLQIFEFSDKLAYNSSYYSEIKTAHFDQDHLDLYDWEGIEHVQFMHDYYFGEFYGDEIRDQMIGYTEFALRHGMTVSNFHFSRDDMEKVRERIAEGEWLLQDGNPEKDTMYVIRKQDMSPEEMRKRYHNARYINTENEIIVISDE